MKGLLWGVPVQKHYIILNVTDFVTGKSPFKYLGVPLSSRKLNIHQYQPIIDKIVIKVVHWTTKLMSYAGRYVNSKCVVCCYYLLGTDVSNAKKSDQAY